MLGEMKIFSGSSHPNLAKSIAGHMGMPLGELKSTLPCWRLISRLSGTNEKRVLAPIRVTEESSAIISARELGPVRRTSGVEKTSFRRAGRCALVLVLTTATSLTTSVMVERSRLAACARGAANSEKRLRKVARFCMGGVRGRSVHGEKSREYHP